jgi:hypothetical protein
MIATNTQRSEQTQATEYRELSWLDAITEVRAPVVVSLLDQVEAPKAKYSRGRVLVVRDVEVARQDAEVLMVGGLFGMVDASETARGHHNMMQVAMFPDAATTPERRRGSVCSVCGDPKCGIGPFMTL